MSKACLKAIAVVLVAIFELPGHQLTKKLMAFFIGKNTQHGEIMKPHTCSHAYYNVQVRKMLYGLWEAMAAFNDLQEKGYWEEKHYTETSQVKDAYRAASDMALALCYTICGKPH